ncbi:probable G-protein coupled receptor Mth-like 1 isoform X1 [Neocloeon triangulifer]|uniref:probable G-protein coupled receptor Mth-like 1 isoform X1 n=1 Tax=Neocloeon triangulifer TaxID=2078957 RepID=UPI00286EF9FB|nr:probable G-protein coupled receptor Mth-like 1 isoform X1 [Neocloeon triangulifer]XP_059473763.1 probable G-protein coupled receptor Mth-like 1 isoform X1 [Neocloeon triangulifer]XP_059473764.1 probable G-protein coupled receptor Mth-like 1 isoform X1 [Neocloeon triangulifer]XP_059473765.1 probable G-protein coupled receptor Mth-like 1 isoform X1 [Neocloeon triangulifer]
MEQNGTAGMDQKNSTLEGAIVKDLQDPLFLIFYVPMGIVTVAMVMSITAIVIILKSAKNRATMTAKIVIGQSVTMFVGFLFINLILAFLRHLLDNSMGMLGFTLFISTIYVSIALLGSFYLSSHFWLNILCFDVFYNFRNVENNPSNVPRGSTKCRFAMYCLYAILLPLVLVYTSTAFMFQQEKDPSEKTSPNTTLAGFLTFVVPVLILNATNFYFIFTTRRNISKMREEMKSFDGDSGKEEAISKTWLTTKMLLMTLCISLVFEAIIIIGLCFDLPPNVVFLIGIFIFIICVLRGLTATIVYVCFFGKKERDLMI